MNTQVSRRQFGTLCMAGTAMLAMPALEGCPSITSWLPTVENDLPEILNIVTSILSVITLATGNGAIAAGASQIVTEAVATFKASLSAFQDALSTYTKDKSQGNLTALIDALTTLQADVPKVLATLPLVVDASVSTVITAGMGLAIVILSAIQNLIPGAAPAAATVKMSQRALVTGKITLPNAASLRAGFNSVLVLHGYGAQQIN